MNYLSFICLSLMLLTACGSGGNNAPSQPDIDSGPCLDCLPDDNPLGRITHENYTVNDLWQEGFEKENLDTDHRIFLKGGGFEIAPMQGDLFTRGFYLENIHCGGITDQRIYVGFSDENIKNSQVLLRITGNRVEQFSYNTTINSNPSAFAQVEKISDETWDCIEGVLYKPNDPNHGSPDSDNFLALGSIAVGKINSWFILAFKDNMLEPQIEHNYQCFDLLYKNEFLESGDRQSISLNPQTLAKLLYIKDNSSQAEYAATSNYFSQIISGHPNTRIFTAHSGIQQEKSHFILLNNLFDKNNNPKKCFFGNLSEDLNTKSIELVMGCQ